MGTYAVAVSKIEVATIHVEAEDAPTAESVAIREAEQNWEGDAVDIQVDDVTELTGELPPYVLATLIRESDAG